jgi:four helix bundle protein
MEAKFEEYITRNKNINRGYRSLDVWKEAIDLFVLVRKKMKKCDNISYKLKGQIEDSALSFPSNKAEGYGRRFLEENIQFNTIALSSLSENYSQIFGLFCSEDIDEEYFDKYDKNHYSLENKLISLNRSFISKLKDEDDWKNNYKIREIISAYNKNE